MENKKIRGISSVFAENFKKSSLGKFYEDNKKDLIIGVRKGYINIYYNCDNIAKVEFKGKNKETIKCEINSYYLNNGKKGSDTFISDADIDTNIIKKFDTIKKQSETKSTPEKKAQHKLYLLNNDNSKSEWFCFDVEWKKAYKDIQDREENGFSGRFDIIAISKTVPYKIAFIELKYGDGAIGGKSGVVKHVKDYRKFNGINEKNFNYFNDFKEEAISIIQSLNLLGLLPEELKEIKETQIDDTPFFYIATLDNNMKDKKTYTPKQTMAAYLFNQPKWGRNNQFSKKNNLQDDKQTPINVLEKDCGINLTFLFSEQTNDNITINDIINGFEEKEYQK